jgi:hypothetical protein
MIRVDVWLPDPASVLSTGAFGAGALIRIERSATQSGTYAEITTLAVVAATAMYTYWDAGGDETSWYRYRISNSGNTADSPYSDPFQGVNPAAFAPPRSYADLDYLLALFDTPITQPAKLARLATLLGTATSQVIEECGHRDYFAHPATGTAIWTLDGDGGDTLHIHEGLVSLSLLELSFNGGLTFVPVDAADYVLRGDSPYVAEPIPDGEPFFHVRFTGFGKYVTFVPTIRAARLTGVRGWPAVPTALVEATAQRARQLAAAGAGYSGADAGGPDEYGRISTTDRFWPQSLYNFLQLERERFMACHMGSTGDRQFTRGGP